MYRIKLILIGLFILLPLSLCVAAEEADNDHTRLSIIKDLFVRNAFFDAHQGHWFDAITRVDVELRQHFQLDEPALDTLYQNLSDTQYAYGDFELSFGMYQQAGHALRLLIEQAQNPDQKNAALYRLARLQYEKGHYGDAAQTLKQVAAGSQVALEHRLSYLSSQVNMAQGNFAVATDQLLMLVNEAPELSGFETYNLGIALIGMGQEDDGRVELAKTGDLVTTDPLLLTLRDKANQVLGERALTTGNHPLAQQYFAKVRLDSPFTNRALLGLGWACANLQQYKQALLPWTRLVQQDATDESVQEALLALPYAYAKLGLFSKAAILYQKALNVYDEQFGRLNASIESVQKGHLLELLLRPEIVRGAEWLVRLRDIPQSPETHYLLDLMSSHEFNVALQNFIDLHDLQLRLEEWQTDISAYREIISMRKAYYTPVLEDADRQLGDIDARLHLRLEQRKAIDSSLQRLLVSPDHRLLATAAERIVSEQLAALRDLVEPAHMNSYEQERTFKRLARLEGVISWNQKVEYSARLTQAFKNLHQLNLDLSNLQQQHDEYLRIRQAATLSFHNYGDLLDELQVRIEKQLNNVLAVLPIQGQQLEQMSVDVLEARREKIKQFQTRARFAMADSYDRAARETRQE